MTARPVRPRARARADVRGAVAYYRREGGEVLALGFVEAFRSAMTRVGENPGAGSPQYADILRRPGLRTWRLERFPYLLFYRETEDGVDVLRVLHGRRDISKLI